MEWGWARWARWMGLCLSMAAGCASGAGDDAGVTPRDAGRDAGSFFRDTGPGDPDAAVGDAAVADGGDDDGGTSDAGPGDAGAGTDAGFDAGFDAGPTDAGPPVDAALVVPELTVLTINLQCLRVGDSDYATNALRFGAIADAVIAEEVDVVVVQEACDDGTTDAIEALRAAISSRDTTTWVSRWSLAHVAYMGTAEEANEGVGLLARNFVGPTLTVTHRSDSGLGRVAVSDVVNVAPFGQVRITSVNFDVTPETVQRDQAREAAVSTLVRSYPSLNAIIAGDFNAMTGTMAHAAMAGAGFVRSSDPVSSGAIEHVYAHRGASFTASEATLLFDSAGTRVGIHPGVLVRYVPATPAAVTTTRITVNHDPGFGNNLSIRGDTLPFDWTVGWPMHPSAAGVWTYVGTEWAAGTIEYKALVNDTNYQVGENAMVTAGGDVTITPTF